MKIILTAFNQQMISKPIDVLENTTPYFYMVLTSPITVISGYTGEKLAERPSFGTKCKFEWTGKSNFDGSKEYVLVDMEKV